MAENVCLKESQAENERLRAENLELTVRLKEARAARPVQNVNNNVTINVVPYGQEEALSAADVRGILQQLPGSETIPRYIEMKHFRNPESSNIRITNKRGRITAGIFRGGCPLKIVIETGLKAIAKNTYSGLETVVFCGFTPQEQGEIHDLAASLA
jgi:hypothetical protein